MPAATFTLTINIPTLEKRSQELYIVDRALHVAAQVARSAGGTVLSGNILIDGATNVGTWLYTPSAPS